MPRAKKAHLANEGCVGLLQAQVRDHCLWWRQIDSQHVAQGAGPDFDVILQVLKGIAALGLVLRSCHAQEDEEK